jgi:hypothetical protein
MSHGQLNLSSDELSSKMEGNVYCFDCDVSAICLLSLADVMIDLWTLRKRHKLSI